MSACSCICVRMLLYTCSCRYHLSNPLDIEVMHMRVRMLLYMCPHAHVYVSACSCIRVSMLLYMCAHATISVSLCYLGTHYRPGNDAAHPHRRPPQVPRYTASACACGWVGGWVGVEKENVSSCCYICVLMLLSS